MRFSTAACCGLAATLASEAHASSPQTEANPDATRGPSGPTVDYEIEAKLDHVQHALSAKGVITLHNQSSAPLSTLYLHLYLNAFKSQRSVFFRSDAQARTGERPTRWANVNVTHFGYEGSAKNLWPEDAHSPGDSEDETDIVVSLPTPVAIGQSARFAITWTSQLPTLVERTGFEDEFHFLGQWFPKLAKLEPDGTWAHFTFHPHSEFYANFGDYRISLDVARDFEVAASGSLETERALGERKQLVYRAHAVHDFAWTAWPGFEVRDTEVDGVRIHLLFPPGFEHNAELALGAVEHGLRFYGAQFGPYPLPDLSVVIPPNWASPAGGMEYPGLITLSGPWFTGILSHGVQQVTLHELAHQWFYGLLASNESQWPFLDEGFTSFAEARALHALLGPGNGVDLPGIQISASAYYRYWGNDTSARIAQSAREFASFYEIGRFAYSRTATLLETLSRSYPEFERALADYARQARYSHPTPDDFLNAVGRTVGAEARSQAERALFERAGVDFAVQSSSCTAQPTGGYDVTALITRQGELQFPIDIRLEHADGQVVVRRWDGRASELRIAYESASALSSVVVDPDLHVLLDGDLSNNAQRLSAAQGPNWQRRILHWLTLLYRSVVP